MRIISHVFPFQELWRLVPPGLDGSHSGICVGLQSAMSGGRWPGIQLRTAIESGTDMSGSTAKLHSFSFVLAVPDLKRSASYFRDALGFRLEWPEGSDWQLVSRGDVRIMIGHCPDAMLPSMTGDHNYFAYLNVDDADALHSELANRGAIILQPPTDRPHGMREFVIGTPDGHRMMVGQELPATN